ncbi:MAG: hypothetical protein COX46_00790 [bacterium (Candidatus Ratteibacteria) CG23_combo_of_CG06-09_8_20_14_all_48_7]|uniref:Divergent polysaccharide deacetylase family protein n=1 Tax=bacterium (Candidatus Ratteibacteria) CG23_combo_of_CG06-09_8_20_14_all_48_7 TaxID=2014292 RepID=A0A2G9YBT3_9BACT|nr:MAG: hypothetical protein COX46_00790 [bacterium (Candidatus Ratteibacteria) CG23_combo_of_CG06-09_8_20_14_all_48_7]
MKRNPLPFLILIAIILWAVVIILKHPEVIKTFYPDKKTVKPVVLAKLPKIPIPLLPRPQKPQIAIIIDDFGYNFDEFNSLHQLYLPVTISVLPNLPSSRRTADFARAAGYEVLLHLPMAPKEKKNLEKGTIAPGMDAKAVRQQIEADLASVGPVSGVNNHMGSSATTDTMLMETVLSDLEHRNLFFVDSVTSTRTIAFETGRELGVPVVRRDVFLDNNPDREYIKGQIRQLVRTAQINGRAIGIGHPHPETFLAIKEMLPEMEAASISLVTISKMLAR